MILCSSIVQYDFSNSSSFCPSKLPHHQASPNLGVVCCSMNNNKSIPYPPHRKPHMFAALPHSRTASTVCTKNFDHLNTTKCGSSNRTLNAMALELLHCSQKNQKTCGMPTISSHPPISSAQVPSVESQPSPPQAALPRHESISPYLFESHPLILIHRPDNCM